MTYYTKDENPPDEQEEPHPPSEKPPLNPQSPPPTVDIAFEKQARNPADSDEPPSEE